MPDTEPLVVQPQEVTQALVAAPGTGYAHGNTITLGNGVVLTVVTLTAGNGVISASITNPGSVTTPPANPVAQVSSNGAGTGATFNLTWSVIVEVPVFPAFTPVSPPPAGGNPPPPTFPPSTGTTPVTVPVGPLVGPQIAAAAVPPSVAGVVQPQYGAGGSATVPTGAGLFPQFKTSPPSPPIVFSNIFNNVTAAAGQTPPWHITVPPSTATTPPLTLFVNGDDNGDDSEALDAGTVHQRHAKPAKRRGRAVLQHPDA